MTKYKLPNIFIFDIDETIIGNIQYIVNEWSINKVLNDQRRVNVYKCDFTKELNEGLLRPYFVDFVKYIKKNFSPCELFLYTTSSYGWTNGPLVKNIEKACGFRFNKPYFTRENRVGSLKSITEIFDDILSTIKSKKMYNNEYLEKNKDKILRENIVFIDDRRYNLTGMKNRHIVCPVYSYKPYRDIYNNMLSIYGEDIVYNETTKDKFDEYNVPYKSPNGSVTDKDDVFFNLFSSMCIRECELYQQESKDDVFFKVLMDNLKHLDDRTIKKINKLI